MIRRATCVILGLLGWLVLIATPVDAHTSLVTSDPPDGAVLVTAPDAVTFTFDEPLLQGTNVVAINREDGTVVVSAPVAPDGTQVRLPWPADLGPGRYQVAYRVVSADGHPVTGAIWIQVQGRSTALAQPTALPSVSTAPWRSSWFAWLLAGAGVLVVAGGVMWIARRRR